MKKHLYPWGYTCSNCEKKVNAKSSVYYLGIDLLCSKKCLRRKRKVKNRS